MSDGVTEGRDRVERAYDPEAFRAQGHQLVDQLADHLIHMHQAPDEPVLPGLDPVEMAAQWPSTFPEEPLEDLNELIDRVVAGANHLHHPRYMGHQVSGPLPMAALCDMVASFLNNATTVYEMAPCGTAMERHVIRWMAQMLGYGPHANGLLTSGGSVGNLTGLLAARQAKAPWFEEEAGGAAARACVLVSDQAHYSVLRAVRIMGWGPEGVEMVPTDEHYRLCADALGEAMACAEARGRRVVAVAAGACSTATGTYDPLQPIADFCEAKGLWFHVDAAHGGAACLSEKYGFFLEGIERADSVVWDAHKMLMMPSLVTGVLYKDGRHAYAAFEDHASYLFEDDPEEEWFNFAHRTIECTKRLSCLKVYAALRCFGTRLFGAYVTQSYNLARRFAEVLEARPDFECAVPPESNIVCFRYTPDGASGLDELQATIRKRLLAEGSFHIVQTELRTGRYLRTTLINPFTREQHLVELLDRIKEIGDACIRNGEA